MCFHLSFTLVRNFAYRSVSFLRSASMVHKTHTVAMTMIARMIGTQIKAWVATSSSLVAGVYLVWAEARKLGKDLTD